MANTIRGMLWQMANSFRILLRYRDIKMALGSEIACDMSNRPVIKHSGLGTVIAKGVKIGKGVTIFQGVTIGNRKSGYPIIEDRVTIYGGSYIVGGITIGKNSIIGCNSVVLKDVPPFAIVAGNPARIIGKVKQ